MIACSRTRHFASSGKVHPIHLTVMNTKIASIISVALCALLASCYPYDEGTNRPKTKKSAANKTATTEQTATDVAKTAEQNAIKEKKQNASDSAATGQSTETASTTTDSGSNKPTEKTTPSTTSGTTGTTTDKPAVTKKPEYSFASKVPGKEGFVFSPYNNKVVDVRDIPSGTLVQDPTYPAAEKKYFRVP